MESIDYYHGILSSNSTPTSYMLPLLACLYSTFQDGVRQYDGYQVLRVDVTTPFIFENMKNMFYEEKYDFWTSPSMHTSADIMVPSELNQELKSHLQLLGINYEVIIDDLQRTVEYERLNARARQSRDTMDWTSYHRLADIHGWMDSLATAYPKYVTVETVGMSSEGRPLKIMKISNGGENKPAIWLDGGIHAREWISPATVTYMANELVKAAVRKRNTRMIDTFDWYIHPVMNPDGYEFTHTSDRFWRKTRGGEGRPIFGGLFGCCKGVDPNRNWAHEWGGKGTSNNLCSQVYRGPAPASEPEVRHVQDYVFRRKDQIKLFLTFHSYSQLLLLPWGYDEVRTDDHDDLTSVGTKALNALGAVYGTKYKAGPTAEILYAAAGGSHDWAKSIGIKYSYCYELRDTGRAGFVLPADQIIPSGRETWEGVKSMADSVAQYYRLGKYTYGYKPLINSTGELFETKRSK